MKAWLVEHLDQEIYDKWVLWNQTVPGAHFFQGPVYARLVNESGIYRHGLVVVEQPDGQWAALISFILLHEHRYLFPVLTTRAVVYGGPVVVESQTEQEKQQYVGLALSCLTNALKNRCLYIQFRNFTDTSHLSGIFESRGFRFSDRLNLLKPIASIGKARMDLSSARRRQLRMSQENGLLVRPAETPEEIEKLYLLLKRLYSDKVRKPLPAKEFFHHFFHLASKENCGKVLLAEYHGEIVGGIVTPYSPGKSSYEWYVCGLDKEYVNHKIYPSVALTWAAMEAGNAAGCTTFDFMGMGIPDKPYGVRDFKARFGGVWVNNGRWIRINNPFRYKVTELAYNMMRLLKKV
jgi:lipid II:glycine glycyltransferase (peptidoglycan interpeptide bridge formation enzyme)